MTMISRTLPVKTYGDVQTLEFNSLGHFAETVGSTLKPEWQWPAHDSFCAGKEPALGFKDAVATASTGLEGLVAFSDKLIDKLEAMLPDMDLKAWRIEHSIVGACPDIPSLLSGEPLHMLQRKRTLRQEAPLSIFIDLISTWNVSQEQHLTKGAAILALVRILSSRRPVTLYAGMQCDSHSNCKRAAMLYFPVDTAPLDLARSAWLMSHQSAARGLMFRYCKQEADYRGLWAWMDDKLHRDRGQDVAKAVLGCEDILYIPPPMSQDADFKVMVNDPARWLVERVMKYGHVKQGD